jgi:hypothetical protein
MSQMFPVLSQFVPCVNSTGEVGLAQLVLARLTLTKRFFTQLGLIGGVDDKPYLASIKEKNKT